VAAPPAAAAPASPPAAAAPSSPMAAATHAMWFLIQTTDDLRSMLVDNDMEPFAVPLMHLGVTNISDLDIVTDEELCSIGMKVVHVRKMRNATVPPATAEPERETAWSSRPLPPAMPSTERHRLRNVKLDPTIHIAAAADANIAAAADAIDRAAAADADTNIVAAATTMLQYTILAQAEASNALARCLAIGCGRPEVVANITFAKQQVEVMESSPAIAADGLIAAMRRLASCPKAHQLYDTLAKAVQVVRDYFIWRTQLRTPIGDRPAFIANLSAAMGFDVKADPNLYSHLMHSHNKEVLLLLLLLVVVIIVSSSSSSSNNNSSSNIIVVVVVIVI
jgi:hypothetical protein